MANNQSTTAAAAGAAPTVAFDSSVSFSSPTQATLAGTVSDSAGVSGVEIFEGTTDLGAANVRADGTWNLSAGLRPNLYDKLSAVATGQDGQTASAASPYTLMTGIKGQPYTAEQAGVDGLSNTYFRPHGAVYLSDTVGPTPHGGIAVTYTGGDFFDGKAYSSFTDNYGPGGVLTKDVENNSDGSHTITGFQDGLVLHSINNDTITPGGSNERYVFTSAFGNDTITHFQIRGNGNDGSGHDILVLPASDSTHLAEIIGNADTINGNTTLHIDSQNSITLQGVTVVELKAHPNDIKFHP